MILLEREGFLRTDPRRGIFVARNTKKEIIEMIQMRAALESMAARPTARHASDANIARLRRLFDGFADSIPSQRIHEYSEANLAFHQAIVNMGGSQMIADTIKNLLVHVHASRDLAISKDRPAECSLVEHLRIVEAMDRQRCYGMRAWQVGARTGSPP